MEESKRSKRLKVLHVLNLSIPNLTGYAIRSKYIVEFQKKNGIEPIILTSPVYERDEPHEILNGISHYRAFKPLNNFEKKIDKIPFLSQKMVMQKLCKKIDLIVDEKKIDIIHAHSPSLCGLPAMEVARKRKLPFIYEVRALWEDAAVDLKRFKENSLKYKISKFMEQKVFLGASEIICICEGLKKEIYQRTKKENIHIVKNGVDTNTFVPQKRSTKLIKKFHFENKTIVGFIGSFYKFEGLSDLIRSVPNVVKVNNNIRFLIVGAGVEEKNLHKLAKKLGVFNKYVIFTGRVPHEVVNDYYSILDILIYPRISLRITELVTPLKPLEAMSMKKPVIVSDVGGLKELVNSNEIGTIFRAGDVNDLTDKIIQMAREKEKIIHMGNNARQFMKKDRDWKSIIPKYFQIYDNIL